MWALSRRKQGERRDRYERLAEASTLSSGFGNDARIFGAALLVLTVARDAARAEMFEHSRAAQRRHGEGAPGEECNDHKISHHVGQSSLRSKAWQLGPMGCPIHGAFSYRQIGVPDSVRNGRHLSRRLSPNAADNPRVVS